MGAVQGRHDQYPGSVHRDRRVLDRAELWIADRLRFVGAAICVPVDTAKTRGVGGVPWLFAGQQSGHVLGCRSHPFSFLQSVGFEATSNCGVDFHSGTDVLERLMVSWWSRTGQCAGGTAAGCDATVWYADARFHHADVGDRLFNRLFYLAQTLADWRTAFATSGSRADGAASIGGRSGFVNFRDRLVLGFTW